MSDWSEKGDAGGGSDRDVLLPFCHDLRQQVATGRLLAAPGIGAEATAADAEVRLRAIAEVLDNIDGMIAAEIGETSGLWEVDLTPIVEECVEHARLARSAVITARLESVAMAYCDPVKVRRAVSNVLDNALRASAVGDGEVVVNLRAGPATSVLSITDTGPGFARIGTVGGFGMIIVTEAVRGAGGSLRIGSGPGPGTTVELELPAHRDQVPA